MIRTLSTAVLLAFTLTLTAVHAQQPEEKALPVPKEEWKTSKLGDFHLKVERIKVNAKNEVVLLVRFKENTDAESLLHLTEYLYLGHCTLVFKDADGKVLSIRFPRVVGDVTGVKHDAFDIIFALPKELPAFLPVRAELR